MGFVNSNNTKYDNRIIFNERKNNICRSVFDLYGGKLAKKEKIQIIPLGGMGEVGKNMTVVRYNDEMIVVDAGLRFPEDDMLGIDLVIPDFTYLVENKDILKAIVITHSHEDHIGALPYVMKELVELPVYGSRLTCGLVANKCKEHGLRDKMLRPVKAGDTITLSKSFKAEFIHVSHSTPDAMAIAVHTPVGTVLFTGDFKIDTTPVDGQVTDFFKLASLGQNGVLALLSDSTNAERTGYTASEKSVGPTFDKVFGTARERIIVATFSSNIHRIQQVLDTAVAHGRRVAICGRSMVTLVAIAIEMGYLNVPDNLLIDLNQLKNYPKNKVVIISTGSQGEPRSALSRMAANDHRQVEITPTDTVIISATPIPGNEKSVAKTVDSLVKQGAEVVYESESGMHVSGHASQEELKLMLQLIKPKFFIPYHGDLRFLKKHSKLAQEVGIPKENIIVAENGNVVDVSRGKISITGKVTSGKMLIDGLGVGDVGNIVLRDRKQLSEDGILMVVATIDSNACQLTAGPDILSRGFVYVRESDELIQEIRKRAQTIIEKQLQNGNVDWPTIKTALRDNLSRFLYEKVRRRPMILPILMEN